MKSPNTGDTAPIEAPTDEFGDTHEDRERYPKGTAAREGTATLPSGQGGATPHDGTSYQDQFPPNPEPDEWTKQWGEYLAAKAKAEREGGDVPDEPVPSAEPAAKSKKSEPAPPPKNAP